MRDMIGLCLLAIALSACNSQDSGDRNAAEPGKPYENGRQVATQKHAAELPDSSSWLELLDRTTGISYRSGNLVCVAFGRAVHKAAGDKPNVIVSNVANDKRDFLSYRYKVPLTASPQVKAQMEALHEAGLLDVNAVDSADPSALVYRLTKKGWGEAPIKSGFSNSLCYETGMWKVGKILDYDLMGDQGSGLAAYTVKYEIEYYLKPWVTKRLLETFKLKHTIPKQSEAVLVKGPDGYFNPNPRRNRGLYQNTIMPNPEQGTRIVKGSDKFIDSLCMFHHHLQGYPERKCEDKEISAIAKSLVVHNVGIPGSGNMTVFKFSFVTSNGEEHFGEGSFDFKSTQGWDVNPSYSLY